MTVYGFVGPSGTGKSHRALEVAKRVNVDCILDDGLLIRENQMLAGVSAKREASRIASIRRALYSEQAHADQVRAALGASGAKSVMIIGTSPHMVDEIAKRLELPPISTYIDIEDVASRSDIEAARAVRVSEGKHVIPVPTFALRKDFSGYFLAPLRRIVTRGKKGNAAGAAVAGGGGGKKGNAGAAVAGGAGGKKGNAGAVAAGGGDVKKGNTGATTADGGGDKINASAYNNAAATSDSKYHIGSPGDLGERTVVRPTFSYLGGYSISRNALEQLINCIALKSGGVVRVTDMNVTFSESGIDIMMSICVRYGVKIHNVLSETIKLLRYEIDRQTSLNVREVRLVAKSLEVLDGDFAQSI